MRLEVIESSGHHVFLTHTRRCLRAIDEFLASPEVVARGGGKTALPRIDREARPV
jgi:hypothetical protein